MRKTGFYIIKNKFFEDMPDTYLKENKAGSRSCYCFENTNSSIHWTIHLPNRVDKSKKIVGKKKQETLVIF